MPCPWKHFLANISLAFTRPAYFSFQYLCRNNVHPSQKSCTTIRQVTSIGRLTQHFFSWPNFRLRLEFRLRPSPNIFPQTEVRVATAACLQSPIRFHMSQVLPSIFLALPKDSGSQQKARGITKSSLWAFNSSFSLFNLASLTCSPKARLEMAVNRKNKQTCGTVCVCKKKRESYSKKRTGQ